MAEQPKSFADYYAAAKQPTSQPRQTPRQPSGDIDLSKYGNLKKAMPAGDGKTDDPLSWLIDIVQRPLYGITNTVQKSVNAVADARKRDEAGQTDIGRNIREGVGAFAPVAFLEGMFSNAPEVKRTFSDVIEQTTDKVGSFDPNYTDVQDNANPILKGVAGFAGDVLADPLTYVPGGLIVKGARALKTGSGALVDAGKTVVETTKATKAVKTSGALEESLEKASARIEKPTPATATEAITARIAKDAEEGLMSKALVPFDKGFRDQQMLPISKSLMDDALTNSPRVEGLATGLAKVAPTSVATRTGPKAVDPKTAKPLTYGPDPEIAGSKGWVAELDELIDGAVKLSDLPKIPYRGKPVSIAAVRIDAEKGAPEAVLALRELHQKYVEGFARAKQQGIIINALGKPVKPTVEGPVTQTLLTGMQTFQRSLVENEAELVSQLGAPLVKNLRGYTNPETFDKAVSQMRGILDRSLDVHNLTKLVTPVQRMLREIGIDPGEIPLGMHQPMSASRTTTPPRTIDEMVSPEARATVDRMVDPSEARPRDEAVELAEEVIRHGINQDIIIPKTPQAFPFSSADGTMRTADLFGEGVGRRLREANNYFQFNMFQPLVGKVSTRVKSFGRAHAAEKRARTLPALRLAERWYDENGVPLTIGVGLDRIPLSMSQVIDSLEKVDLRGMQVYMWNVNSAVPPTNLMDAVYNAIKTGNRTDIEQALRQTTTRYAHNDGSLKTFKNSLASPQKTSKGGVIGREAFTGEQLITGLTNTIEDALPILRAVVEDNAKRYTARRVAETYEISDDVLRNLEDVFTARQGYGEILEELSDTSSRIRESALSKGAMQTSVDLADATIRAHIPADDMLNAVLATDTVRLVQAIAFKTGATGSDLAAAGQRAAVARQQKGFDDYVSKDTTFMPGGNVTDLGEHTDQILAKGIKQKLLPVFSKRAGNELLHEKWRSTDVLFKNVVGTVTAKLSDLSRKLPQEAITPLLVNVQKGVRHTDPAMQPYQDEVAEIWGQMFGSDSRNALIDNAFFRNNTSIHHINAVFSKHKLDDYLFDADRAAQAAKANGTTVMEEAAKQVNEWVIPDVAQTLNKLYTSFVTTQTHMTMAQHFMKTAKDLNATSSVPQKGYSLVGNDSGKSIFAAYLPDNVYFRDEVLHQMHVVDNLVQQTMEVSGPVGDFINNVYRPAQDAWKYGMTIINPTHHIRNMNSDFSLTFYAEGMKGSRGTINAALQAMATRNGYSNWDAIKALQGVEELPDAGKIVAQGRLGELTSDGLYTAMANRGNLPGFKTLENLEEEGRGGLAEGWQKVTQTKGARVIGGVSEARDHFSRLQHAAQFINKNIDSTKYKSMDELLDDAAEQVRKWHPDGSDMTRAEQYFRLIIPFYSWQRKAIPLVIEAALTQPARVLALPKAQMAVATSMGVNPDSLADPFPQDQMFPSYMTSQMSGPVTKIDGKYYGINPGFAANDVLGDLLGGEFGRSVLGSVSPLIRAPFEMAAGGQVGTGARINDDSDYVDSQLPVISPMSRMTGHSVSGSLVSMFQGQGLDPQYQIAKGNKDPVGGPALAFTNWMTGLGIQPMSQQNQINFAEIEKRNKEGEQRGF